MIRKNFARVITGILVTSMCFGLNGIYSNAKNLPDKASNKGVYKEYLIKSESTFDYKVLNRMLLSFSFCAAFFARVQMFIRDTRKWYSRIHKDVLDRKSVV